MRGRRLRPDDRIRLSVGGAAFGMAGNDIRAAGIGQHLRRNVAGMRPGLAGVAVLAAERNPAA